MKFPKWVNRPGSSRAEKATNRLRYIIGRLALEFSREGTTMALCQQVGVSHSTVSLYIKQGSFSDHMALSFEETFGKEFVCHEWLRRPLTIEVEGSK